MKCPDRACKALVDLDLPVNRLDLLHNTNKVMGPDGYFVDPTVFGVKVPNLWGNSGLAKKQWNEYKSSFNLQHSGPDNLDCYRWSVREWLEFVLQSPVYLSQLKTPQELEIIIRGDGFPVGGKHASFVIASLGNFGQLSQCLAFNFPLVLAEVDEKNRSAIREVFAETFAELNAISRLGRLQIGAKSLRVRVEYGGDESWLRNLLGLKSCREDLGCFKCYWSRKEDYIECLRQERCLQILIQHHFRGTVDVPDVPLITSGSLTQCHHCGMHAIMAFGKDLCAWSFDRLRELALANNFRFAAAQHWLDKKHITVNIMYLFFSWFT